MSRLTLRALLHGAADEALRTCVAKWCTASADDGRDRAVAAAAAAMEDEATVRRRLDGLPRKLQDLFEAFLRAPGNVRAAADLFAELGRNFKSKFDLEASLAALHREAFLFPAPAGRNGAGAADGAGWAVPGEIADCVLGGRQRRQSALRDVLTLQGHLDARHFRAKPGQATGGERKVDDKAADHARKIYKLYSLDNSIQQRLDKLPAAVRGVVDTVLHKHGGVVSWADLTHELDAEDLPDQELVRKCLEERMLGTVAPLDLTRFGIQPADPAIVVFHEVALYAIRSHGHQQVPQVGETLACGVDLPSNVGRFLRELQSSKVLFTADGELFKASQKRIAGLLLPVPGGKLSPEALLDVLYKFCLQRRLIDRRGERGLRPTPAGLEFDRASLHDQVKMLLAAFVEDRTLPGEAYHQVRLRRVLLRLLRRAEPMLWQDISILPFLVRNAYLAQIDVAQTEEFFATRFCGGGYTPTETVQQMCWNLLQWVKKRLFPLGLVDIGLRDGRPVALRLSKLGAEVLETEPATRVGGTRSTVIVNPDFEILLFPGDDVHDVVHEFDRFAKRLKSDHVHQFKLDRETVLAGIADGLEVRQIVQELTDRARAPIPQNVLYTLEDWAGRGVK